MNLADQGRGFADHCERIHPAGAEVVRRMADEIERRNTDTSFLGQILEHCPTCRGYGATVEMEPYNGRDEPQPMQVRCNCVEEIIGALHRLNNPTPPTETPLTEREVW